jgi:spermidine synthase
MDLRRLTDKPDLAVFVSGVASMGLEILAGRLVAPQFGSSIFTWGTIIGVFLAALSYGYYRGGRAAATVASTDRLARLFRWTALYVAGLIVLGDLLLRATVAVPLPSRLASLPAVVLLFGPPTYLLGFVSPYAAELADSEATGEASGHVYAVGTVGSLVGAFATTYVLVPELPVNGIALVFGALAVLTALVLQPPSIDRRAAVATGLTGLLLIAAAGSGAVGVSVTGEVVYETQTPYQELRVVDRGDTRTLYLDGQRHSAMDLEDPRRHVFEYTRYFHLPFLFVDDPDEIDRVLFVGGGGFTGPKRFVSEYDVTVDVAEIDPVVVDTAKEYFGVEESPRLRIHTEGGRQYLRDTDRTYDLIVLDAYKKDKVPFQLTTVEMMRLVDSRLDADGVLVANVISAPRGPAADFYRAQYKTMDAVFPQVYSFPTEGGSVVQNVEVVATKSSTRLTETQLRERNAARADAIGIDLRSEVSRYADPPPTADATLLTDDHAPVDSLLDPMVGYRYVVQETGPNATNGTGQAGPATGNRSDAGSLKGTGTDAPADPGVDSGPTSPPRPPGTDATAAPGADAGRVAPAVDRAAGAAAALSPALPG